MLNQFENKNVEVCRCSLHHQPVANQYPVTFDAPAGFTLTRHITEAGNVPCLAEVQDETMRVTELCRAPLRVRVIRRLAVNGVFRRAAFSNALLSFNLGDRPAIV